MSLCTKMFRSPWGAVGGFPEPSNQSGSVTEDFSSARAWLLRKRLVLNWNRSLKLNCLSKMKIKLFFFFYLNKVFLFSHKREFTISEKVSISIRKNTILLQQIWDKGWYSQILLDELLTLWCECGPASPFFPSVYIHAHVHTDSAPQCVGSYRHRRWMKRSDPDLTTSPVVFVCLPGRILCALDLAIRFFYSSCFPNWPM